MTIPQLNHFIALAETKYASKAGEICCICPDAINKSIDRLQGELGIKLFEIRQHSNQRIDCLTEKGEIVYRKAKILVAHFNEFYEQLKTIQ